MEEKIVWNNGNNPKKYGEFLVTLKNGTVCVLNYYEYDNTWIDEFYSDYDNVIAWAEKPKGYKE